MKKMTIKKRISAFVLAMAVLMGSITPIQAFASEPSEEMSIEETNENAVTRAGTEVLPMGSYSIGGFTFYGWNTTPVKTIPSGAKTIRFQIAWNGDYNVSPRTKLYFQIRDTNRNPLSPMYSQTDYTYPYDPGFVRCSELRIPAISVSPGQKIQLYFATDNDPSGAERRAKIASFVSYVE